MNEEGNEVPVGILVRLLGVTSGGRLGGEVTVGAPVGAGGAGGCDTMGVNDPRCHTQCICKGFYHDTSLRKIASSSAERAGPDSPTAPVREGQGRRLALLRRRQTAPQSEPGQTAPQLPFVRAKVAA